jgi:hypothetical protein
MKRILDLGVLAVAVGLALLPACHEGGEGEPCDDVDCAGHGTCFDDGSRAQCDCFPGFEAVGLECVEEGADADGDADADLSIVASDDFESGGLDGGSGWASDWFVDEGTAASVRCGDGGPGACALVVGPGWVDRPVDLGGRDRALVVVQVGVPDGVEPSAAASLELTADSSTTEWRTGVTFGGGDAGSGFQTHEVEVHAEELTSTFGLGFAVEEGFSIEVGEVAVRAE